MPGMLRAAESTAVEGMVADKDGSTCTALAAAAGVPAAAPRRTRIMTSKARKAAATRMRKSRA